MRHHDFMAAAHRAAGPETDLFGLAAVVTQCGCCDKVVPLTEATVSTYHITECITEQEHFCSPKCAKDWWEAFHARD